MGRRIAFIAAALVLLFAAAQLIRPSHANPPVVPGRTIEASLAASHPAIPVLYRACGDCHSNRTAWGGIAQVAPLSWVMASAVSEGRRAVNFSEWADYTPERRQALLAQSCRDALAGSMPPSAYTAIRRAARLSPADIRTICAAAGAS